MKKLIVSTIGITVSIFLSLAAGVFVLIQLEKLIWGNTNLPEKNLTTTIYTPRDIIFIDELQVTFEVSPDTFTFKNKTDLLSFIEERTARDSDIMKEYQVELDFDTVRIYKYGKYIDCYTIGKTLNQFDEICALDNR